MFRNALLPISLAGPLFARATYASDNHSPTASTPPATTTPIKHLVSIFGENHSFDHYFGTYPQAANSPGERAFRELLLTRRRSTTC